MEAPNSRGPAPSPRESLQGARTLLVEDQPFNQEVAREVLGQYGIEVVVADNGQAALDALDRDSDFDLILMDLQMPIMDGYQATRRIREREALNQIPIVALTAHALAGEKERCIQAGMNDFIVKPIQMEALNATLLRWIQAPAGRRSAPAEAPPVSATKHAAGELPEALPGLAVKRTCSLFDGDTEIYFKLLRRFAEDYREAAPGLERLLAEGDLTQARREAHALAGVAGNLGADELAGAAREMDRTLAQGRAPGGELQNRLQQAMRTVLHSIESLALDQRPAETAPAAAPGDILDAAALVQALQALQALIQARDMRARKDFQGLRPRVRDPALRPKIEAIGERLERLDFKTAEERVGQLLAELR